MIATGTVFKLKEPLGGNWDYCAVTGVTGTAEYADQFPIITALGGFESPQAISEVELSSLYVQISAPEAESAPWQTPSHEVGAPVAADDAPGGHVS